MDSFLWCYFSFICLLAALINAFSLLFHSLPCLCSTKCSTLLFLLPLEYISTTPTTLLCLLFRPWFEEGLVFFTTILPIHGFLYSLNLLTTPFSTTTIFLFPFVCAHHIYKMMMILIFWRRLPLLFSFSFPSLRRICFAFSSRHLTFLDY